MIINNDLIPIIVDDIIAYARRLQLYPQSWRINHDYYSQPTITITLLAPYALTIGLADTTPMDILPGCIPVIAQYPLPDTLLASYCRQIGLHVAGAKSERDINDDAIITLIVTVTDTAYARAETIRAALVEDPYDDEAKNPII